MKMGFAVNGLFAGIEVDFLVLLSGTNVDKQALGWLWRLAHDFMLDTGSFG